MKVFFLYGSLQRNATTVSVIRLWEKSKKGFGIVDSQYCLLQKTLNFHHFCCCVMQCHWRQLIYDDTRQHDYKTADCSALIATKDQSIHNFLCDCKWQSLHTCTCNSCSLSSITSMTRVKGMSTAVTKLSTSEYEWVALVAVCHIS